MAMKLEKQSSKLIKPSTPTPPSLKHYKIGFIGEFSPMVHVAIVLFFTKNNNYNPKFVVQLEESLKETLTCLYPLAGRYVEASQTVECNDEGVEFIQAKVNIKVKDILCLEANVRPVDEFIPFMPKTHNIVLRVQLTTFACGGVALGVSGTHKVVDASTLCTFLNYWAATSRRENESVFMRPSFDSSSLFPARGVSPMPLPIISNNDMIRKYTRKKVSLSESAILNMKAKAIASGKIGARQLSKVQLVSSIIWKALISVDHATHDNLRESILIQPINLREKMAFPIPKHSCGNLWGLCATEPTILEITEELANLLNDSVKKARSAYSKVHQDSEQAQTLVLNSLLNVTNIHKMTNAIFVTSFCNFPFYEADFGLGKPIWAVPGTVPLKNLVHLIDGVGGNGVEAYIFLAVEDLPYFEGALDVDVYGA